MKRFNRALSILLTLALVLTLAPVMGGRTRAAYDVLGAGAKSYAIGTVGAALTEAVASRPEAAETLSAAANTVIAAIEKSDALKSRGIGAVGETLMKAVANRSEMFEYLCATAGAVVIAIEELAVCGVSGSFDESGALVAAAAAPKGSLLIAASYDGEGRMADIGTIEIAEVKGTYTLDELETGSGYTFRLMLLDSVTYEPLCEEWENETADAGA